MALEEKEYLYQILVRLGPDGVEGISATDANAILRDGAPVQVVPGDPRPIEAAEVKALLGAETAKLLAEASAQRQRADQAEAERDAVTVAAEEARVEAERAESIAQECIRALEQKLSAVRSVVAD